MSRGPSTWPERYTSIALALLIVSVLGSIVSERASLVAGGVALAAFPGAVLVASVRTRVVSCILAAAGLLCLVVSVQFFGERVELSHLGSLNQDLVAMLVGGAFVRGVLSAASLPAAAKLTGTGAVMRTAFVSHFMGSILNIAAIGLVGDRLRGNGRLSVNNASLLTMAYSTAALWSPFWTVTALILTHFPGTSLLPVSISGVVFAGALLAAGTLLNVRKRSPAELADPGFPLHPGVLAVPTALIVFVVGMHSFLPNTPVPRLVLLALICIPFVFGIVRLGWSVTRQRFARVATLGLTGFSNESALFIAAGIFTVGGSMLTSHLPFQLSGVTPSVLSAWLLTVAIALLSLVGVHPIVTVSISAALAFLVPSGGILYAAAIAWGWSIAAPVGPLAGTVVYLSQRYRIPGKSLITANLPFAGMALAAAYPGIACAEQLARLWGSG